jgi:Zn-dependent protease
MGFRLVIVIIILDRFSLVKARLLSSFLVFNLVPALPLDGGRILRAALWARSRDFAAATHRATRIGGVLAAVIIAIGLVEVIAGGIDGLWLVIVGWFIRSAGRAEAQHAETRRSA